MDKKLSWSTVKMKIGDLVEWDKNPVKLSDKEAADIARSLDKFGLVIPFVANAPLEDGKADLIDGHQRKKVHFANLNGGDAVEVDVRIPSRPLSEKEREELVIRLRKNTGEFDTALLQSFEATDLAEWGFTAKELNEIGFANESMDAEPQIDRAEELREKWGVELGQMWQLGEHRIICGDCTDAAVVERVMGGEKAVLLHADPPYGMGKEKDGIANDNLYREELDAFQMAWWRACRSSLEDNASVYIWGNAPDLWRLWYSELRDSERLTVRNEIVWKKEGAQGVGSDRHRMYPTTSERCLFFVLGEQGFNNNADNYWDGWESIRFYLAGEAEKVGLDNKKLKKICGVGMYSHWFGKSQWELITENHYKELQNAFNEYDTFKKEYDKLKKEFYATRAYFDNTHENMTDVWQFGRVFGDDRYGHATPKPVEMIERVVKTSARVGDLVLVPFGGTSPELIAAENLGRRCRAVDDD